MSLELRLDGIIEQFVTYDSKTVVPLPAKRQMQSLVEVLLHILREDSLIVRNVLQVIRKRQIPELEGLFDDQLVEYVLGLAVIAHDAVLFGVL